VTMESSVNVLGITTTNQPDTKSKPNPNPATKQHAVVNIQLNIGTSCVSRETCIRDHVIAPFDTLFVVIVPWLS